MRLLECVDSGFRLTEDFIGDVPPYAILSHTWETEATEVTFRDLLDGGGKSKLGMKRSGCVENRLGATA